MYYYSYVRTYLPYPPACLRTTYVRKRTAYYIFYYCCCYCFHVCYLYCYYCY